MNVKRWTGSSWSATKCHHFDIYSPRLESFLQKGADLSGTGAGAFLNSTSGDGVHDETLRFRTTRGEVKRIIQHVSGG